MAAPSGTYNRPDLGVAFSEVDLIAMKRGLIGPQVLPFFSSALQGANFHKDKLAELLADIDMKRSPRGDYPTDDYEFDQDSFRTTEYGCEVLVDDRQRAIYRFATDIEVTARNRAILRNIRAAERRIANAVFNATTFASYTAAAAAPWSNAGAAAPIDDVKTAMIAVRNRIGEVPNALIIDFETSLNLANCDQLVNRVKFWGGTDPSPRTMRRPDVLAAALGIDRVIVAGMAGGTGMRNSADKGQAASLTAIWRKDYAMVAKLPTSDDFGEPCIGRTITFAGDGVPSDEMGVVEQYRDDKRRGDVIRVRHDTEEKILFAAAGQLLTGVAA